MSRFSYTNYPWPIVDHPFILTKDEDGFLRAVPPKEKNYTCALPIKAKEPSLYNVPQVEHLKTDGCIFLESQIKQDCF